jgi:hypothetical protein
MVDYHYVCVFVPTNNFPTNRRIFMKFGMKTI